MSPMRSRSTTGRALPAMRCPEGAVAQAVALADKLEALAGLFGVGQAAHRRQGSVRAAPRGDRRDPHPGREAHRPAAARADRPRVRGIRRCRELRSQPRRARDVRHRPLARLPARAGRDGEPGRGAARRRARDRWSGCPHALPLCARSRRCPKPQALAAANKRIVNILRKSGSEAAPDVDRARLADGRRTRAVQRVRRRSSRASRRAAARATGPAALKSLSAAKPVGRPLLRRRDGDGRRRAKFARTASRCCAACAKTMNRVADISKLAT